MKISETGKYLGYTLGRELPTLYFENGHFTQCHSTAANVGWHPNKSRDHYWVNITEEGADYYDDNCINHSTHTLKSAEVKAFVQEVEKGTYKPASGDTDIFLFEYDKSGDDIISAHCSGGYLIRVGEAGFDEKYNEAYAIKQLESAELAANESR